MKNKKIKLMIIGSIIGIAIISTITYIGYENRVVSSVGEYKITAKDVKDNMFITKEYVLENNPDISNEEIDKILNQNKEDVLTGLENGAIIYTKMNEFGIMPSEEDLSKAIEKEFELFINNLLVNEEMVNNIVSNKKEVKKIKLDIKNKIITNILRDYVAKDYKIAEEELVEFYDGNKNIFSKVPTAELDSLVFRTKEEAKNVLDEIKRGLNFDDAMEKYNGAYYGYVEYYDENYVYEKNVTDGTKGLKENEVSEVIETSDGYRIFKAYKVNSESKDFELDEIREKVENVYLTNKKIQILNEKIESWRDGLVNRK